MSDPLSFEAAVSLLDSAHPVEDEPAAPRHDPVDPVDGAGAETGAEPVYDDLAEPADEPTLGADDGDPAEAPAIAPPRSWDAEARAAFAALPREAQERIAARENERDRAVSRAQQEASDARRKAETEASNLGRYQAELDQLLPRAERVFADRWRGVDWVAWAQADPAAAQVGRLQYEAEQGELARLNAVHQLNRTHARGRYMSAEAEKLSELAPDLADPREGPSRKAAVARFLIDNGAEPQALADLGAAAISIAYDAMRYRAAETALKTRPPQAGQASARVPARAAIRPAASEPASAQTRGTQAAANRFAQSGSVDDAIALLNARSR